MNSLARIKLNIIEKITSIHYFLFFTSLLLFSDTYFIIKYKMGIRNLSSYWINTNLDIFGVLIYLFFLSLFYAVLIPFLLIVIDIVRLCVEYFSKSKRDAPYEKGLTHIDELKNYAISNNNFSAYKVYEHYLKRKDKLKFKQKTYFSLLLLSPINLIISKHSITRSFYHMITSYSRFIQGMIITGLLLVSLGIIEIIFEEKDYYNYVNLHYKLKKSLGLDKKQNSSPKTFPLESSSYKPAPRRR